MGTLRLNFALCFLIIFIINVSDAQWIQSNQGLTNTAVYAFAVSGTNIFAGTWGGGVFLSTNNGGSWAAVNSGLTWTDVSSLVFSGSTLFAGTYGGVYRSTNNGTSWTAASTGLPYDGVWILASNGSNLFAGTYESGIYRSTNNGTSWTTASVGLTDTVINILTVSGTNIFAGTESAGVFRSTNNGSNWTAVNTGLTNLCVTDFAILGTYLFTGTYGGGVFCSTNNGSNWTAVNTGLTNLYIEKLLFSGTNLFTGTEGSGVFLSMNNGDNWSAFNSGISNDTVYTLIASGTNIFAGTEGRGIFRRSLTAILNAPTGLAAFIGNNQVKLVWDQTKESNFLRYRIYQGVSSNPTAVVDSSTDNKADTAHIITGLTNGTKYYFRVTAVNNLGLQSGYSNEVSSTPSIYLNLTSPSGGELWLSGSTHPIRWTTTSTTTLKLEYSTDGGTNWSAITSGINSASGLYSWTIPNVTTSQCIIRITDSQNSLNSVVSNIFSLLAKASVYCDDIDFFNNVTSSISNPDNYLSSGRTVRFKIEIKSDLPTNTINTAYGTLISYDKKVLITDSTCSFNTVYAGGVRFSTDELEIRVPDSIKSGDVMFLLRVNENFGLGSPWTSAFSLPIAPLRTTKVYIDDDNFPDSHGNGNGIVEKGETIEIVPEVDNSTSSYLQLVRGKLSSPFTSITVWNNMPGITETIFDTYSYGSDSGTVVPLQNKIQPSHDYVVDYNANGIYRVPLPLLFQGYFNNEFLSKYARLIKWEDTVYINPIYPIITSVKNNSLSEGIKCFSLVQNFPNPFNPSTQIDFSIPQSSHVTLRIYDMLGKEVATLVNGKRETGTYTSTWNAQNCPSGVYFYRLNAGSYTMTRKLILLR